MNVTEVDLYSGESHTLQASFLLDIPKRTDKYILKAWTGLDAQDILPRLAGSIAFASGNVIDMYMKPRLVSFLIKLNPQLDTNQTVGDLRDELYKMIATDRFGLKELRFINNSGPVASLFGFIDKYETNHFTNDPEVKITFLCQDPFLRSNDTLGPILPVFTDNSFILTDEFSTAPHGVKVQFSFTDTVSDFLFGVGDATLEIDDHTFEVGDILYLSSEYNDRYLYVIRSGVTTNLVDKIRLGSIWPVILPGGNNVYRGPVLDTIHYGIDEMLYHPAYWGI